MRLLAVLALLALAACSTTTIRNDRGGNVVKYAIKVGKTKAVRFDGECMSACTLYLAHPNKCLTRRASFWFHRPYGSTPANNNISAEFMLRSYPLWVRDWIANNGGLTSRMIVMPYSYAIQHMRPCT